MEIYVENTHGNLEEEKNKTRYRIKKLLNPKLLNANK